ncbi:LPP20 family lipoprotein [Sulfurimonas sp. NW7]|uniref:LPP20 family lipoprotein n=1 Tax=Sulfurimonas sp. NW7 TaxID=2922727 RepID=UPI003DAA1F79
MKKNIITGSVITILALGFSACAYKQQCGTDECGHSYIDRTYRSYNTTKQCNAQKPPIVKQKVKTIQTAKKTLPTLPKNTQVLQCNKPLRISVVGQGVAPCNGACSPAQALALAKRAAIADAYRLIAEKVKGVYVEGNDYVKNMMIKKSTIRTHVAACLRNTNIVETSFKDGLCQVEMEIKLKYADIIR